MTDHRVETRVVVTDPDGTTPEVGFQEYFVGRQHQVPVRAVRLVGVESALAAPGVLEAIGTADRIVICPSNPVVSIGPVLATGGIGPAVAARRERVVAVSPIVAGKALKGPADHMLAELGHEASVVGVARLWSPYAGDPGDRRGRCRAGGGGGRGGDASVSTHSHGRPARGGGPGPHCPRRRRRRGGDPLSPPRPASTRETSEA